MNYLTRLLRRYAVFLVFLSAILFFFILRNRETTPWVQLRALTTTLFVAPVAYVNKTWVEWKGFLSSYRNAVQRDEELNRLRVENTKQMLEILQLQRKLAGQFWETNLKGTLPPLTDYHLVTAEVVFRSPSQWFYRAVVDKGVAQRVKPRSAVISTGSFVVGKIHAVYPDYSILRIFIDAGFVMGGKVVRTGELKVLEGKGAYAVLQYFPLKSDVQVGDRVITSGQDGIFPPGLPVGSVSFIREIPSRALLEVRVVPGIQLTHLERVMILVPEKEVPETL